MTYLFSTGTARGGTGLVTRMLSVSSEVEIALDPYLDLYKTFRAAVVEQLGEQPAGFNPRQAFSDYYFSEDKTKLLEAIQSANLDLDYCKSSFRQTLESVKARMAFTSGDLIDYAEELTGDSIKALFESALDIVYRARKKDVKFVGWHENWVIECLPAVARAFPEAKFLIVLRDPRAVVNSAMNSKNVAGRGQMLSYCRCLRKQFTLASHYESSELFAGRLRVVRFEDVVAEPELECKKLCEFLGIRFSPEMLDTNNFVEPSTGEVYNGFSSFEDKAVGFSLERVSRWKQTMPKEKAMLVDFLCGPEMQLYNYQPSTQDSLTTETMLNLLKSDLNQERSWRVDFNDLKQDLGFELFRNALRDMPQSVVLPDFTKEVKESYLVADVFEKIQQDRQVSARQEDVATV